MLSIYLNKPYSAASKLTEAIPVITKWKNKTPSGPWQVPRGARRGVTLCIVCSVHIFVFFHANV